VLAYCHQHYRLFYPSQLRQTHVEQPWVWEVGLRSLERCYLTRAKGASVALASLEAVVEFALTVWQAQVWVEPLQSEPRRF